MHGSLPKACPHSGPVPLRSHTHIAPGLNVNKVCTLRPAECTTEHIAQWQSSGSDMGRSWVRAPPWGRSVIFVAAPSFVRWHIIFAAFLCARLQLLCFAFLLFYVCSLRFYVFYVRHNISANRAGVIRFCYR
jgi:hypothetical protein